VLRKRYFTIITKLIMATTQSIYRKSSLAFTPRGAVDGVVPTIKPTDGSGDFTFSRGTGTATRVNASGLIEKERGNLLLQSNTFSTNWTNVSTTETGGQSGYDGSNDAWLLQNTATAGRIQQGTFSTGVKTMSVYAKAGNVSWIQLYADDTTGSNDPTCYFDLSGGGAIGTSTYSIDEKIEDVGGGWFRCSFSFNATGAFNYLIFASQDNDVRADSGENIYIQDAQLEQGLVATDYIETTTAAVYEGITDNLPRLDYSGGASCPSLLLESSRTNVIPYSEYIDGTFNTNNCSFTTNSGISPEGVQNSTAVNVANLSNGYCFYAPSVTTGVDYMFSAYYKGTAGETLRMRTLYDGNVTEKLVTLTGDWQREEVSVTGGSSSTILYLFDGRLGDLTATDFEVWGAQLEAGSYPTSYIPTYGTAASKSQDFAEATFAEGTLAPTGNTTLFIEFESSGEVDTTPNTGGFYLKNAAGTLSHWGMSFGYSDGVYSNYTNGSTIRWAGTIQENTTHKVCFQFVQGGKSFLDGATQSTTSVDWSTKAMGQFELQYGSKVKQAILFPTILTDAECIALTTL
jgi:hypothetical protein